MSDATTPSLPPPPTRRGWWIVGSGGFLTVAVLSGLIAWANGLAEDTAQLRRDSVPKASIAITALDTRTAFNQAMQPPMPKPIDIGPLPNPDVIPTTAEPTTASTAQATTVVDTANLPAWKNNASALPTAPNGVPKIAIIVGGLGLRAGETQQALQQLPPAVTIAVSPYGRDLSSLITAARQTQREVLIELPLEPQFFPSNDPGNLGLLVDAEPTANQRRLDKVLTTTDQAVGLIAMMGGKFLTKEAALRPVLQTVQTKGLIFVDNGQAGNSPTLRLGRELRIPTSQVTLTLDTEPARRAILNQLQKLEQQAQASGFAIGLAQAYPLSIELIARWAQDLPNRGLVLQPITRLIDQQVE